MFTFTQSEVGRISGRISGEFTWILQDRVGYATKLMNAIELLATQRQCVHSYLDTFSFQARPVCEKLGNKVFGTLENHPKGHSHYFVKKAL